MKKKIVKNYIYDGLGFPVELHNIELVLLEGEFHPRIDIRQVADATIKTLVTQENRLTGNQIKFIRSYFSMSLREFSKVVNESHAAVKKWEDCHNKKTNMDPNIEIMLRLYIYDQVIVKSNSKKIEFYNRYIELTKIFHQHQLMRQ